MKIYKKIFIALTIFIMTSILCLYLTNKNSINSIFIDVLATIQGNDNSIFLEKKQQFYQRLSDELANQIEDSIEQIENGLIPITYEMFGAVGDGVTNDANAIKLAHDFANIEYVYNGKNLAVNASADKTYLIRETSPINITTNVNWNGAHFIFDDSPDLTESQYTKDVFRIVSKMRIKSGNDCYYIKDHLNSFQINKNTKNLSSIVDYINSLSCTGETCRNIKEELQSNDVSGYLIYVYDSSTKVFKRIGVNSHDGSSMEDVFIIDKNGNVKSDIIWDFNNISEIRVFPIYKDKIIIDGGSNSNITTRTNNKVYSYSEESNNCDKSSWVRRGIDVDRSNVEIKNINHYLDENYNSYTDSVCRHI